MSRGEHKHSKLVHLGVALESGAMAQVRRILNSDLQAADVAHLLESTPKRRATKLVVKSNERARSR